MAYFILAVWAVLTIGGLFAAVGAAGYVFYHKVIVGSSKSIRELLREF